MAGMTERFVMFVDGVYLFTLDFSYSSESEREEGMMGYGNVDDGMFFLWVVVHSCGFDR